MGLQGLYVLQYMLVFQLPSLCLTCPHLHCDAYPSDLSVTRVEMPLRLRKGMTELYIWSAHHCLYISLDLKTIECQLKH